MHLFVFILFIIFLQPFAFAESSTGNPFLSKSHVSGEQREDTFNSMEEEFKRLLAEANENQKRREEESAAEVSSSKKVDEALADIILETNPTLKKVLESHELAKRSGDKSIKITAILLTGDPGLGKTLAGKVLAQRLGLDCTVIQASGLGNEYQDSAASNLDRQFSKATNSDTEHVVIIDEIHTLMNSKKQDHRVDMDPATRLCQIMDSDHDKKIIVVATANDIKNLSAPLQSRFDRCKIKFDELDEQARKKIISFYAGDAADQKIIDRAGKNTDKMSIRHIDAMVQEAKLNAYRRNATKISPEDLDAAIKAVNNSINLGKESKGWFSCKWCTSSNIISVTSLGIQSVGLILTGVGVYHGFQNKSELYAQLDEFRKEIEALKSKIRTA